MYSWNARTQHHGNYYVAEEPAGYGRARQTVYLDTSIPSYLTARLSRDFATARRQRITRVWWERYRSNYELRVSDSVLTEAGAGDFVAAQERLKALDGVSALAANELSDDLVTRLIGDGLLPLKALADAEHIAIAAANSVDILLTWNYKHLANRTIHRAVVQMCEAHGFRCPEICTPEKLMRNYAL